MKEKIECPKCGADWIEEKIDAMLHEMRAGNGSVDFKMSTPIFRIYAAALAEIFVTAGGENFLTTGMYDSRHDIWLNLTIEKMGKKSTGQIIGELKEEIKQLKAACQNHSSQQRHGGSGQGFCPSPKLPEEPATSPC